MGFVNREEFLARARVRREEMEFGDGSSFLVTGLTSNQIGNFEELEKEDKYEGMRRQFAMCVLGEDRKPIFDVNNPSDMELIRTEIGLTVLSDVVQKSGELSGRGKKVEDVVKN